MKKALITGALGQDGSYLAELLLSKGYEVWGTVRRYVIKELDAYWIPGVNYMYADLTDELSLDKVIRKCWPDEIYNLGGQVFVPTSWTYPAETFDVNLGGLARIMNVLEKVQCKAKVYQASSSEMFGNALDEYKMIDGFVALDEGSPMEPCSPYGVSKYAAHRLVDVYRQKGWHISSGILFNHESPRRGPEMVTRKISLHVAKWRKELPDKHSILKLGNIKAKRDWGFAGDYVEAMWLMLQQKDPGDYVIGTGESHSIADFINEACKAAQLDLFNWGMCTDVEQKEFNRANELHTLVANADKARRVLGWSPKTSFEQLVAMMVNSDLYLPGHKEKEYV